MPEVDLLNSKGENVGKISLPEEIFGKKLNSGLVHEALLSQLAMARQGTACTKTRAEVTGGGAKPWRQKGTGRARAGSIRSPLWRHGGITFGPKGRSYRIAFPKKKRRNAIKQVLSEKIRENGLRVIDSLTLEEGKTKKAKALLEKMGALVGTLVIAKNRDANLSRAFANLPKVKFIPVQSINIHDLLNYEKIIITRDAIAAIVEGLS
ncbi:50S ribosomal protein L4 [bacterium]|nr:50S ribosomal protein L4 [bacterium]NIN92278.1 50S ribosomal protein L4 [bacterium]NIO18400.1 50S ribosomal protein L4 [bacterium]NIO73393.1 50S ribosomal protein L4 [bacterium]